MKRLAPAFWVFLAAALVYPVGPWASQYVLHVLVLILVYMVLAMGLSVLPGFCGLLDLGFVGFYGIGAYTAGLMTLAFDLSFWVVVPLACACGALFGVLRGAPTLRLTGDYFAIVTFGFSELVVMVLTNEIWLTRGPLGLTGIAPVGVDFGFVSGFFPPGTALSYEFSGEAPYFYLALAMAALVYLMMHRAKASRLGRAWLAIREDELAAASAGVDAGRCKTLAFAVSAGTGALAGAFLARWSQFLSPDMFKFWESFLILCMVVLGGLGSIEGACVGAAALIGLGEVLRSVLPGLGIPVEARFLAYGLIMILIMRFRPNGLFAGIAKPGPCQDGADFRSMDNRGRNPL
jgi:branched-chain amino acid transport system permease protein